MQEEALEMWKELENLTNKQFVYKTGMLWVLTKDTDYYQ